MVQGWSSAGAAVSMCAISNTVARPHAEHQAENVAVVVGDDAVVVKVAHLGSHQFGHLALGQGRAWVCTNFRANPMTSALVA